MWYNFLWEHGNVFIKIDETPDKIEKLLDEYRKRSEYYNIDGWIKLLTTKGYKIEAITDYATIRF